MPDPEESLSRYRELRDFSATPEPSGDEEVDQSDLPRFVIQEHHATALHWDLRLERDGVLKSWAVPKGIPPDPRVNHLAVQTEDHPLLYLSFSGDIPEGSYGAGQMSIWDSGTYETEKFSDREVMVTFHGGRARGRHVLFRTGGNQWMIHRMDPAEDPSRELMPESFPLVRATPGPLPDDDDGWGFEVWWEGLRVAVPSEGGRARAITANGDDVTDRFPEVRAFGAAVGTLPLVVDGIFVVAGDDGRPDTDRLARRRGARSDSAVRRVAAAIPAALMIFDLLWLDGHATTSVPYRDRRRLLEGLELVGPSWQTPSLHPGDGAALLDAARTQGLPGVIAKRLDRPYDPSSSSDWIAVSA